MQKSDNMKYGRYCMLLATLVAWIAAALHLEKLYAQQLLILETGRRSLTTGKEGPPKRGTTTSSIARARIQEILLIQTGPRSARFRLCL